MIQLPLDSHLLLVLLLCFLELPLKILLFRPELFFKPFPFLLRQASALFAEVLVLALFELSDFLGELEHLALVLALHQVEEAVLHGRLALLDGSQEVLLVPDIAFKLHNHRVVLLVYGLQLLKLGVVQLAISYIPHLGLDLLLVVIRALFHSHLPELLLGIGTALILHLLVVSLGL